MKRGLGEKVTWGLDERVKGRLGEVENWKLKNIDWKKSGLIKI